MPDDTGVPLLDHIRALLHEKDQRDEQRFLAQTKAVEAAFLAQQTATSAALLAAKEAVTKAEVAADKRFELLNELRVGVATTEQLEALEKQLNDLAARVDRTEGRSGGLHAGWGYLVGAAGLISVIVVVVTRH